MGRSSYRVLYIYFTRILDRVGELDELNNLIYTIDMEWNVQTVISLISLAGTILTIGIAVGVIRNSISTLNKSINEEIKPDLKDVRERFFTMEGKISNFFKTTSPISLTSPGREILEKSGLKKYLDDNKEKIITTCESGHEMKNQYDIQQAVFSFFDSYKFPDEFEEKFKTYAYSEGISMEILKRIGGIYFRDFCLKKHGFSPEDLDKN